MTKKMLLQNFILNGAAMPYTPAGFWFHFSPDELVDALKFPKMIEQNIEGHKKFFDALSPDFVKIMSDGFFIYPNDVFCNAQSAKELWNVKSIGGEHPWIEKQVQMVRAITDYFNSKSEIMTFYNVFSPATTFKFVRLASLDEKNRAKKNFDKVLSDFITEDPAAVKYAFNVLAEDLIVLLRRITGESSCSGIFFSTQNISDTRITSSIFNEVVAKVDHKILNSVSDKTNILHICGYEGHHNNLGDFVDYPAAIVNWASVFEGVSLSEGKKIFKDKIVLGGFDNTKNGVLYKGLDSDITEAAKRLVEGAGGDRLILGADCAVPRDIDISRIKQVYDYLKRR